MKSSKNYLILAIILVVVTVVYSNHFNNPFHFDDFHTIQENPYIRSLKNIRLFFTDPSTYSFMPTNQNYRPVTTLSVAIDYFIAGGLDTFYFHLSMFFWFLVQLIIMYLVFESIAKSVSVGNSFHAFILFAVAWYGLHPAIAETINYISSRSDSLSTLLVVFSLWVYIRFPAKRKFYFYLVPAAAGVFTKQSGVVFAPILAVYILLFELDAGIFDLFRKKGKEIAKQLAVKSLPAFIVCIAAGYVTIKMHPKVGIVANVSNVLEYAMMQPWVIIRYAIMFLLPVNLSADPDWTTTSNLLDERIIVGFIFVTAMIYVALKTSESRKTKPISFGIFWFFLALLPTSSVIPLTQATNDHRVFFPFIGLVLAVSWFLFIFSERNGFLCKNSCNARKRYIALFLACSLLILNALGTRHRNRVWSSTESLWYDVTQKSPGNSRGFMNYGLVLMERGNFAGALDYFNRALRISPESVFLHVNLGILKDAMGNYNEAEKHFFLAAQNPVQSVPPYHYAKFLKSRSRFEEAIEYCKKSIGISKSYMNPRHLLMELYLAKDDRGALKNLVEETRVICPDDEFTLQMSRLAGSAVPSKLDALEKRAKKSLTEADYLDLSLTYYKKNMFQECIEACQDALKVNPAYAPAWNNICSAYIKLEDFDKAIESGLKALEISPDYELAKNNLDEARRLKAQSFLK